MGHRAEGSFDVTLTPIVAHHPGSPLGRMAIDKRFDGDLSAVSQGEMLAVHAAVKGSAGYVAIERVEGTLRGQAGSFVLQHAGVMNRGVPTLTVQVVPDSGTGALVGLVGTMQIVVDHGAHRYIFEYDVPAR